MSNTMKNCSSLIVARTSKCPSNTWKTQIYDLWHRQKMKMINIGANSGSNVNEFLLQHDPDWNVSAKAWHEESKTSCGVCQACMSKIKRGSKRVSTIRVIAVELLRINYNAMAHNFKIFNVPGVALNAAGGATIGDAWAPVTTKLGQENIGLFTGRRGKDFVPMLTVDGLTTMFGWHSSVDFLSIDTEGHDAHVLRGAHRGLMHKNFRVVEFEYHREGNWRHTSLNTTVAELMTYGYTCFWQGNDAFAQYEVECDNEIRQWSNLVCAHEDSIVNELITFANTMTKKEPP